MDTPIGALPTAVRGVILALTVVATAAATGAPVVAQEVGGIVREAGTGTAVVGALVRLVDEAGAASAPFVTGGDGRYRLTSRAAGLFVLLIERIGYADTRIGPLELVAGETLARDLVVATSAVEIRGFTVDGRARSCDLSGAVGGQTAAAWDQVRKALDLSSWTERQHALVFELDRWQRQLTPQGMAVRDETRASATTTGGNSVRSLPAAELAEGGYVRTSGDEIVYYAPDAEVLLSDSFLDRHCFSLIEGTSDAPMLGLAFEPLDHDGPSDVEGVIWVERISARLDRIEFTYTGRGPALEQGLAGGVLRYTELPDGHWIVRSWHVRAPAMRALRSATRGGAERYMVADVYETGSEVTSVRGPGFEWVADRPTGRLVGVVYDSTRAGPLPGAVVRVAGRGWRTVADEAGAFTLPSLPVGRYRVVFEHARLDTLGVPSIGRDIEVTAGDVALTMAVPSARSLLAEACPGGGVAAVVGQVTLEDGTTPVGGVEVVGQSLDGSVVGAAHSRSDGWYRICERPTELARRVVLRVTDDPDSERSVVVPEQGYAVGSLSVGGALGHATVGAGGVVDVTGTVVDAATEIGLPGATVDAIDEVESVLATTTTDDEGMFVLSVDRAAGARIRVRAPRYETATGEPLPPRTRRHRARVELAPEAVEVEGVVVEVDGGIAKLEMNRFYHRRRVVDGVFLDEADVAELAGPDLSTALLRLPQVERWEIGPANTTSQRVQIRAAVRRVGPYCMPAIYLDGRLARAGWVMKGDGPTSTYPTLDDLVSLHDVLAVEVYDTPAVIPIEFTGPGALCGVIVLWTR